MSYEQVNQLIALRRFSRYVVDGDEIIIQHLGVPLDGESPRTWRAFLNRTCEFGESARWAVYEAARVASGKVARPRPRDIVDREMRDAHVQSWPGLHVPEEIGRLTGGIALDYFVGPRAS